MHEDYMTPNICAIARTSETARAPVVAMLNRPGSLGELGSSKGDLGSVRRTVPDWAGRAADQRGQPEPSRNGCWRQVVLFREGRSGVPGGQSMAVLVACADSAPLVTSMVLLHARPHLAIAGPLPKLSPSVNEATR